MLWIIRAIKRRQQGKPSVTRQVQTRDPKTLLPDRKACELFDRIAALNPQLPPPNAAYQFDCIVEFVRTHTVR